MSNAASMKDMETLHSVIATKLATSIKEMEPGDKGLAALLSVARQFVKDNGIEAKPTATNPLGNLVAGLNEFPFNPEDSVQH